MEQLEQFLLSIPMARLRDVARVLAPNDAGRTKEDAVAALLRNSGPLRRLLEELRHAELVDFARRIGATPDGKQKRDYITAILDRVDEADMPPESVAASRPEWQRECGRPDLERVPSDTDTFGLAIVPSRPGEADQVSLFDFYSRLRSPELRRVCFVSFNCSAGFVAQLLGPGRAALTQAGVRLRDRNGGPGVTLILDSERHGLDLGDRSARTLVELAAQGLIDLRLGPSTRRMHAKIYAFELEDQDEWGDATIRLDALIGSSNLTLSGLGSVMNPPEGQPHVAPNIEANVRLIDPGDVLGGPGAQLRAWLDNLVDLSRPLVASELNSLPREPAVARQVAYARDFDSSQGILLKAMAEELAVRGRHTHPLYDTTAIPGIADHQLVPVVRSSTARLSGYLLFDEVGLGKTIEAGLILARERRRRRVVDDDEDRKQVLIIAPPALHEQWKSELRTKFGITSQVVGAGYRQAQERDWRRDEEDDDIEDGDFWRLSLDEVLITSPAIVQREHRYFPAFDIVVVDECHRAKGDQTFDAVVEVCRKARFSILASGTPIQNALAELWIPAVLVAPGVIAFSQDDFAAQFRDIDRDPNRQALLRELLAPVSSRSYRRTLLGKEIQPRVLHDRRYALSPEELLVYRGIEQLRDDYRERRGGDANLAFLMMEQTFLSSPRAFEELLCRVLGDRPSTSDPEVDLEINSSEAAYQFLKGRVYRSRLVTLRDQVQSLRALHRASLKEESLLALLRELVGQRVLLFTRFRATQRRIEALLHEATFAGEVRALNGMTPSRERQDALTWFTRPPLGRAPTGWASGILVCTDVAAEGLNLQQACSALVNYDLPWNPQRIEQRIGRLQRWGQKEPVRVFNFAAHVEGGRTKDDRVLQICREKFGMADQALGASERLFELDELEFQKHIAQDDDADIHTLVASAAIDQRIAQSIERVIGSAELPDYRAAVEAGRSADDAYRRRVGAFFERATLGVETPERAQGHLQPMLRDAMLGGAVGILRRPDSNGQPSVCVGVRILLETDLEDVRLIEDETAAVWRLWGPGQGEEWRSKLLEGGLLEVLGEEASPLVGEDLVTYLRGRKRALVAADCDAAPLTFWREGAPARFAWLFDTVEAWGGDVGLNRERALRAEWESARRGEADRIARSMAHLPRGAGESMKSMKLAFDRVGAEEYTLHREVLITQMILIL